MLFLHFMFFYGLFLIFLRYRLHLYIISYPWWIACFVPFWFLCLTNILLRPFPCIVCNIIFLLPFLCFSFHFYISHRTISLLYSSFFVRLFWFFFKNLSWLLFYSVLILYINQFFVQPLLCPFLFFFLSIFSGISSSNRTIETVSTFLLNFLILYLDV